jgi:hypothetical protein
VAELILEWLASQISGCTCRDIQIGNVRPFLQHLQFSIITSEQQRAKGHKQILPPLVQAATRRALAGRQVLQPTHCASSTLISHSAVIYSQDAPKAPTIHGTQPLHR